MNAMHWGDYIHYMENNASRPDPGAAPLLILRGLS